MPSFSKKSQDRLDTCNPLLVELFGRVVVNFDCTILEGARSENRQMTLLEEGKTKLKYPDSKHNVGPGAGRELSDAVDVVPYPIDWRFEGNLLCEHAHEKFVIVSRFANVDLEALNRQRPGEIVLADDVTGIKSINFEALHNIQRWFMFIGHVKGVAAEMGIPLVSGADWDGDNCMADQRFDDLPHFEVT